MSDDANFVYDGFDVGDENIKGWDGQGGGGTNVPEGEHRLRVLSCTQEPTKNGDGKNFVMTYQVVDGPAANEELRQWYLCAGDKFKTGHKRRIVQVFRNALRVPFTDKGAFEGKDVIGREMYATCKHETVTKYNPETQADQTFTNASLSMERPTEDEATEIAAAAAPAKAASAPPARPPAAPARPPARPAAPPPRPPAR